MSKTLYKEILNSFKENDVTLSEENKLEIKKMINDLFKSFPDLSFAFLSYSGRDMDNGDYLIEDILISKGLDKENEFMEYFRKDFYDGWVWEGNSYGLYEKQSDKEVVGEKLIGIVESFVKDLEISCSEAIHQSDRVIENAYEFIEKLCDVVGYYNYDNKEILPRDIWG